MPICYTNLVIIFLLFLFLLFSKNTFASEPTITDFWNQKAEFKYSFSLTEANVGWTSGFDAGVHVEIVGSDWFLFTRHVLWGEAHPDCSQEKMYTEIRKSSDQGKTWSQPIPAISNTPNSPWECAATDGDAFYNSAENRWDYLFQCLGKDGKWSGCHATRNGSDPYGSFTPDPNNPVIIPGEIWSKICTNPDSDCYKLAHYPTWPIFDEGTFDIFDYQNNYYYVSFHGTDGIRGYRGVAKTKDFNSWETINHDAILDLNDAKSFNTPWDSQGPIGFGAGTIIKDQNYYYIASEAADKSLACTQGQNWVIGLFRTSDITSTNWEKLPAGNPFFTKDSFPDVNPSNLPCYPEYTRIFTTASGKTFLHVGRPSFDPTKNGIYFYELKFKPNNLSGDYNNDGKVDLADFSIWKTKYLAGQMTLVEFSTWKAGYLSN